MNNKFRDLTHPSYDNLIQKMTDDPEKAPLFSLEYVLNCMIIDEFNTVRKETLNLDFDKRKKYVSNGKLKRKFKLSEGEIELTIPRFRDCSFKPRALEIAENLHEFFKKKVSESYISGESDRDLQLDSQIDKAPICRMTASRYFQEELNPEIKDFLTRDFQKEDYIDLQMDAMYTTVEEPALPKPKYRTPALIRVLGLSKTELKWESLALAVLPSESSVSYELICEDLINRNIGQIYVVTTDFHKSFRQALTSTLIGVELQGCRFHHQRDLTKRVDEDTKPKLKEFFEAVYDRTYSPQEAIDVFEETADDYGFNQDLMVRFKNRFLVTLTYKNYPSEIAKEISTTGLCERCNEEERRRLDPRHISPNDLSLYRLSVAIAGREKNAWFKEDVLTLHDAFLSQIIHDDHLENLNLAARKSLSNCPKVFSDSLSGLNFPALWCNVFVVPVDLNGRAMTIGFLAVFGVDKDKTTTLIALSALKSYESPEILQALKNLKDRGLDLSPVELIIQNTNLKPFVSALESFFEPLPVYTSPDRLLRRLLYLTPEDFKEKVEDLFKKIYRSPSQSEAYQALDDLESFLRSYRLFKPLALLMSCGPPGILNGLFLAEKIWPDLEIDDFKVRDNWSRKLKELRNHPKRMEQTVKELVKVLSRKQCTKVPSPTK